MMGVIAFFAGLVIIGTVVDITINILNLDEVFSDNFGSSFINWWMISIASS